MPVKILLRNVKYHYASVLLQSAIVFTQRRKVGRDPLDIKP